MGTRHPQVPRGGSGVRSGVHRHAGDRVRAGVVRAVERLGLHGLDDDHEADDDRHNEWAHP